MDNSDVIQIVSKIGEVHADLKSEIGTLKSEFTKFQGATQVRLDQVEDNIKTTRQRQWLHSAVIMPGFALLHGLANHFGVKI